jgi:hypothetical protein
MSYGQTGKLVCQLQWLRWLPGAGDRGGPPAGWLIFFPVQFNIDDTKIRVEVSLAHGALLYKIVRRLIREADRANDDNDQAFKNRNASR